MIDSNLMKNAYKILIIVVFLVAITLRIFLSIVNCRANDDHLSVIEIIKNEKRLPTKYDGGESYQPKLYHLTAATIWVILPFEDKRAQIVLAQLLNSIAGLITIFIVWLFLNNTDLANKVKLICLSIVALNPKLIGINAQVTNDSFVIMFSTAAIYYTYRFLVSEKPKYFYALTISTIFAGLSKGNGLIIFLSILLIFIFKLIKSKNISLNLKGGYFTYALIFCLIYFAVVPVFGQYYYNYRQFGSPFIINQSTDPFPHVFKNTYHKRPGVTSIVNSYFTYRFLDLIRNPMIKNDIKNYPLHRTSLWSQLYGRTHFVFFDNWPDSWQTNDTTILNLGRIILVIALIPTFILLLGAAKEATKLFRNIVRGDFSFIVNANDWIFDIFLAGYILFIISYTLNYRDFSSMKAIFVFPALLPFVYLFSKGMDWIYNKFRKLTVFFDLNFCLLFFLYSSSMVFLIRQLLKEFIARSIV